jgi:hypothetical protein
MAPLARAAKRLPEPYIWEPAVTEQATVSIDKDLSPNGAAWAAMLAAAIGGAGFGVLTDMSECSARVSKLLQWYRPAGALSGVAICAMGTWIVVWSALHIRWQGKRLANERRMMFVTLMLALAAIVTTFPPFYELFGG